MVTPKEILFQVETAKSLTDDFEKFKALNKIDQLMIEYFGIDTPEVGEEASQLLKKKHHL